MTHKDYILIAEYLNGGINTVSKCEPSRAYTNGYADAVKMITYALKSDNSRFDVDRFMTAVLKEV